MRSLTVSVLTAGAFMLALASPADATVTISTPIVTSTLNIGDSTTINFNAQEAGTVFAGVTSSLYLQLVSQSPTVTVFSYTLTNAASFVTSRLTAFGFNVDPNSSSQSITSAMFTGIGSGSISGSTNVEVCFESGPSCAGGGGGGLTPGMSSSGTFTLNFSGNNGANITLDNFVNRYQAVFVNGVNNSAIGIPVGAVPEPATWALMLFGFGGMGVALRRGRRSQKRLMQIA